MEKNEVQEFPNEVYEYAGNLMFEQKRDNDETRRLLTERGLAAEDADRVSAGLGRSPSEVIWPQRTGAATCWHGEP